MLPWIEKYRPNDLNNIVLPDSIRNIFNSIIHTNILPNMLFYGPPGSGKTSTARIFIQSWYPDGKIPPGTALFLNASDERGLESIRERVFPFLQSKALLPEYNDLPRFLVFDEAETLTASAQLALRSVLSESPLKSCCILFLVVVIVLCIYTLINCTFKRAKQAIIPC